MSLYNALFGTNTHADLLLHILGINKSDVPRFRDCYFMNGKICIHTRTGGGNRDYYESEECCRDYFPDDFKDEANKPIGPWNTDLRKLPTFLHDQDDEFDSTYATFFFNVPPGLEDFITMAADETMPPAEKWKDLFTKLKTKDINDPLVKRAMDVIKPIIEKFEKNLEND